MALYREAINALRLDSHLDEAIGIGSTKARQAMSDHEIVESSAAMQILGGDSANCIERIRGDKVLQALICRIPSKSTVHNFLAEFDDASQEKLRGQGKLFVPARNAHLDGFDEVTKHILSFVSKRVPHTVVTLGQDAAFINTKAAGALFNYKKEWSFEALSTYCGPGGKSLKLYKTTVPAGSIPERTSKTSLIRIFLPSGKIYVPCRQNGNKSFCCRQGKSFRQGGGEDKVSTCCSNNGEAM